MKTITLTGRIRSRIASVIVLLLFSAYYTSAQTVKAMLTESWENGAWSNYARATNTYDGNNYQNATLYQSWTSDTNSWDDSFLISYNNNVNGSVRQSLTQMHNEQTGTWENFKRITFDYNTAAKVTLEVTEMWARDQWQNVSQRINDYDVRGNLVKTTYETWDAETNSWKNETLTTYTNNANGTVAQALVQFWSRTEPVWNNSEKKTYTYNASDKQLSMLTQVWLVGNWADFSRETNNYDSNGRLINALSEIWVPMLGQWRNDTQYNYANNSGGTISQSVTQFWNSNGWNNELRFTFTYNLLATTGFDAAKGFRVYPNPTQDSLTIASPDLLPGLNYSIADQTGRSFLKGTLSGFETSVDVKALASGVYYIQIGQQKQHTIKMIKD